MSDLTLPMQVRGRILVLNVWMDAYLKRCNNLVLNKYCILIYSTTYNMQYYQYPPHHHVTGCTGGLVGAIKFSYFYINVSLLSTTYTSTQ